MEANELELIEKFLRELEERKQQHHSVIHVDVVIKWLKELKK